MTAGHCLDLNVGQTWSSADRLKSPFQFGSTRNRVLDARADAGVIEPYTTPAVPQPWVFVTEAEDRFGNRTTTRSERYVIRGVDFSKPRTVVCMTGATNGSRCGEVLSIDRTVKGTRNLAAATFCGTAPGDSGGAVFKGGIAYGLFKGTQVDSIVGECQRRYYTSSILGADALNVSVVCGPALPSTPRRVRDKCAN